MPRKARELVDDGIYHIFNRGNNRMHLFLDANDFEFFLARLLEAIKKQNICLYHYCLMSNHYHLLVQVKNAEALAIAMHFVQLKYARYYKKKYSHVGHVFQERFRSLRIPAESYFLQCGRYIERNPVKAAIVPGAQDYLYSSAVHYVKGKDDPLITENPYYRQMGNTSADRRENYKFYLLMEEPYGNLLDRLIPLA